MEVVTFISASHGAVARIRMPMPSKGGAKIGWNPVLIHAPTEEEARQRAEDFYRTEQQRFAALAEGKSRRIEKAAATRAARQAGAPA